RWSDRFKEIELPLFPGYLFCRFDPKYQLPIIKTPGIVSIISFLRTPAPVEEYEIAALQTMMASSAGVEPWPYLKVGQFVRGDEGPLRDLEGILIQLKKKQRLVVSVTLLQRSVAVELDRCSITPVISPRVA